MASVGQEAAAYAANPFLLGVPSLMGLNNLSGNAVGHGAGAGHQSAESAGEAAYWRVYQQLMKTPGMSGVAAKREAEKARQAASAAWSQMPQNGGKPGAAPPGTAPAPDTPESIMRELMNKGESIRQENAATADEYLKPYLGELEGAAGYADHMDDMSMGYQDTLESGANETFDQLALDQGRIADYANQNTNAALGGYMGATDPLMSEIQSKGWGDDVLSDAESMAAQRQSLKGYQDLSNPQVTAQERYLQEIARRNQEQQERASRDAVMTDLQARGMAGSGAQLTNMLGTQQQLAQERTLADLGTQAQAVSRSMDARAGAADMANSLRSSADLMSQYNKSGAIGQQNWQTNFGQSEADRLAGLAGERYSTQEGANETTYGRGRQTLSARAGAAEGRYQRGQDTITGWRQSGQNAHDRSLANYGARGQYVAQRTGRNAGDFGTQAQLGGMYAGFKSADEAAERLEEDDDWWNPFD